MKRIILLALCVILLCALMCSCGESEKISAEYIAQEGGYIEGVPLQEKELGKSGTATFGLIIARENEGYRFIGWSDGATDKIRLDTLSASASFTAMFEKINYATVTYECGEGGVLVGEATQRLEVGKTTTEVTVTPSFGYRFLGWSDGVMDLTRSDLCDTDKTVSASFTNKVTVKYVAGAGGSLLGSATQELTYGEQTTTIWAIPESGYRFIGWDDSSTAEKRTDRAEQDVTYTAIFKKFNTVTFLANSERGTIVGSSSQIVDEGESSIPVMAVPLEGYAFVAWSNGSTDPIITLTPTESESVTALFVRTGSGLSVVSIDTETGKDVTSRDSYINCVVSVYDNAGNYHVLDQSAQIRGRGNSTWTQGFPKKPYKIKLNEKQDVFGFGKAKDWVLLADYIDKSLLRNYLSYTVAGQMSRLEASPDCRSVEVYLNGEYHGVYLLCEQVEVNKHRVEVEESVAYLDTGYLVEMDGWAYQTPKTSIRVPDALNSNRDYSVKFPNDDELTDAHKKFIQDYLIQCITAIEGDDYSKVTELIDVHSFAQGYIIFEAFKCADTNYSSLFFHKDAGGKLKCGPVWDFDMGLGNVNHKGNGVFKDPKTLWTKDQCPWFNALLKHEEFFELVCTTLAENEQLIRDSVDDCFDYAYAHQESYEKNFEKWEVLGINTWTNPSYIVDIKTWEGQVEFARDYFNQSLAYMLEYYAVSTE